MNTTRTEISLWEWLEVLASPRARQVAGVFAFALLTAIGARVALPIPGTPVPFTFQPLAVLLAGGLLGARLGAASQIAYLAAGFAGLPVFAIAGGGTLGYLLAFPLAAYAVGALARGGYLSNLVALVTGLFIIYAGGVAWLAILFGWNTAIATGFLPFILPDLVKAFMAMLVMARLQRRSLSLFGA
jgi:biotin transport system substrate-specific component